MPRLTENGMEKESINAERGEERKGSFLQFNSPQRHNSGGTQPHRSSSCPGETAASLLSIFLLITTFNNQTCLIMARYDICGGLLYTNKVLCDAYLKKKRKWEVFCCDTSGNRICMGVTSVNWLMGLITVRQSQRKTKVHAKPRK